MAFIPRSARARWLIWFLISGWYYGLPIPIEPMKAIAVVVIAEKLNAGEIAAAGIILGFIFLLISYGPLLLWLEKVIPEAVVRGQGHVR